MMTGGTHEHLLVVLQHYAPTGSAQQECAEFYGLLQREGLGKKEIDLQLVNMLQDGLAHGTGCGARSSPSWRSVICARRPCGSWGTGPVTDFGRTPRHKSGTREEAKRFLESAWQQDFLRVAAWMMDASQNPGREQLRRLRDSQDPTVFLPYRVFVTAMPDGTFDIRVEEA